MGLARGEVVDGVGEDAEGEGELRLVAAGQAAGGQANHEGGRDVGQRRDEADAEVDGRRPQREDAAEIGGVTGGRAIDEPLEDLDEVVEVKEAERPAGVEGVGGVLAAEVVEAAEEEALFVGASERHVGAEAEAPEAQRERDPEPGECEELDRGEAQPAHGQAIPHGRGVRGWKGEDSGGAPELLGQRAVLAQAGAVGDELLAGEGARAARAGGAASGQAEQLVLDAAGVAGAGERSAADGDAGRPAVRTEDAEVVLLAEVASVVDGGPPARVIQGDGAALVADVLRRRAVRKGMQVPVGSIVDVAGLVGVVGRD